MDKIKIEMTVSVEEGLKILEALKNIPGNVQAQKTQKKTVDKWPYWCWNCRLKIDGPPKLDDHGDMVCPCCGLIIPEP